MMMSWEYVKVSCVRISTMHNGQLNIAMSEMFMKSVLGTDFAWIYILIFSEFSSAGSELPDHIQD